MNTITNLNTFPIGNSLDGINIITDEIEGSALLIDGSNYMLADLNMNNHIIKNLDAGVDSLDAVNKSQLDTKADTTYVNTQLGLKVNKSGDTMTGNLNMNLTNKIINLANGTSNNDATNFSQLNDLSTALTEDINDLEFYVDSSLNTLRNYVNDQDNLKVNKAGDTMTGTLNINYSNAFLDIRTTEETQDSILYLSTPYQNAAGRRKTAIIADGINSWSRANLHFCLSQGLTHNDYDNVKISDSRMCIINNTGNVGIATTNPTERLDINGNAKIRGFLDMSLNKVVNLTEPTLAQDAATKNYVDSKSTADRSYVDASLNLKVNKAGDTMTDYLGLPEVRLSSQTTSYNPSNQVDISNRTNTYAVFEPAGTTNDFVYLRQLGGFSNIHLSLDFHDNTGSGQFSLRSINSINNPDSTPNTFFYSSPTLTSIKGLLQVEQNNIQQILLKSNLGSGVENTGIKFNHSSKDVGFIGMETIDSSRENGFLYFKAIKNNSLQTLFYVGYDRVSCSDFFTTSSTGTGIFNPTNSTNSTKHLNLETNGNGVWLNPYLGSGAYTPLVSSGDKGIIFSNGTKETGNLVIGPWSDSYNGIKIIGSSGNVGIGRVLPSEKLDVAGRTLITSNATEVYTTSAITYILKDISSIYDYLVFTASTSSYIVLPELESGINTMVNKTVYISFPNQNSGIYFIGNNAAFLTVNGSSTTSFLLTSTYRKLKLTGSSTIGVYTIVSEDFEVPLVKDQLTLRSEYGSTISNREFTGIRFLNTDTDAGFIRCETDKDHSNSVMRFYTRSSNDIVSLLELSNVITANKQIIANEEIIANKPIIRKEWSSGELVKTSVYGGSGLNKTVTDNSTWVEIVSLTFTADANVDLSSCAFVINFNTSYYISGYGNDNAYSKVSDVTGTEQVIQITRQRYEGNYGGGSRSGTIFPVMCQYTPSQSTSNKTRTIKIYAKLSSGGDDTIYISNNNNESANNWHAEIKQVKT